LYNIKSKTSAAKASSAQMQSIPLLLSTNGHTQ